MGQLDTGLLPEGGKARRVYLLLKGEIAAGRLTPGTSLPGEQKLAETHGVSRVTVRRALETLAADGLIEKRTGAGSVVTAKSDEAAISADIDDAHARRSCGWGARRRRGSCRSPTARRRRASRPALGLAEGQAVQTAVRVRLVGETPFSHLTTHVPEDIARNYSEADLATTPLFSLLERGGVDRAVADAVGLAPRSPRPDVAEALGRAGRLGTAVARRGRAGRRRAAGSSICPRSTGRTCSGSRCRWPASAPDGARHWEPVIGRESGRGGR